MSQSVVFSTYFDQFDWLVSVGSLSSVGFPFLLLWTVANPVFMSGGFLESSFTWIVMTLAKFFSMTGAGAKVASAHFLCFLSLMLLAVNLTGMVPFVKGVSGGPAFCFCLAFLFWGAGAFSTLYCYEKFIMGMWVKGAPLSMNLVVVTSEVLSWLIRPVVMGIRLVVNVACGHILLAILGELSSAMASSGSWCPSFLVLLGVVFVSFIEWVVLVVQVLVFVGMVVWTWGDRPMSPTPGWWSFGRYYCKFRKPVLAWWAKTRPVLVGLFNAAVPITVRVWVFSKWSLFCMGCKEWKSILKNLRW